MKRVGLSLTVLAAIVACRTYETTYTDDAGSACVTPRLMCSGVCVDPNTDRLNCGTCNFTCGDNQLCENGVCVLCPNNEIACGTGGAAFCTDTSIDSRNCGSCGSSCAQSSTCIAGQCACPLTTCGTDCVDLQTSVAHCGACNTPCPSSGPNETAVCSSAQCGVVCTAPFADCDGVGSNGCEASLKTSSTNCGVCGRACAGNGACTSGMCPTVTYVQGAKNLAAIAVDSSFVYWVDQTATTGAIDQAPIGGGTAVPFYADNQATVLATDGTRLVWLHLNDQIESRLLTGGAVTLLASPSGVLTMGLHGGYVYFGTSSGTITRVPTDGSASPTNITFALSPQSIVADDTNVYVATLSGDVVFAPVTGQGVGTTTLALGVSALALADDATNVYWIAQNGDVVAHAKTGGQQTTLAKGQTIVTNLATDGTSLYWGATDQTIRSISVTGGAPLVLATGEGQVEAITVDATSVYWTASDHVRSTSK